PQGYHRLPSIVLTAGLAAAGVLAVSLQFTREAVEIRLAQQVLAASALALYLFNPIVHHYASEVRPYAFWNTLWFLALALVLNPKPRAALLGPVLTLMSFSATATCFQLAALGTAFLIVAKEQGRPWKEVVRDGLAVFLVPTL